MALYAFEVSVFTPKGALLRRGVVKQRFVGTQEDADREALNIRAQTTTEMASEMEADAVGWVIVMPALLEPIGPYTLRHILEVESRVQTAYALADVLVSRLAPIVARERLELNPNLKEIAGAIMDEALAQLVAAQPKPGPQLVGADGKTAVSGGRL